MTTAYTSLLGLALPVTGELSGTWGDVVNQSITGLLDTAVAGTTTLSTDGDVTLTTTTGTANQARQAILLCSGARTALRTITAPAQSKTYLIINATTGGYSVKLVGVGPTTGVTIVAGESALVAWNGSDFIKVSNTGGAASFTNVTVSGTTTLSGLTASTALALDASKNVVSVTNTGTGNNVLSASPTLTGTIGGASLTLSSLTSGRVTYAGASGLLQDSASLTFDGTTLTAAGLATGGSVTLSGGTANGVLYLNGSKVVTSGSTISFDGTTFTSGAHTLSTGNLNFSSTSQRITGDFSNATISNRLMFQSSTTNGNTGVGLLPNGTSLIANLNVYANSDPTNTSFTQVGASGTAGESFLAATRSGTGTYLPMTFYTGGSERVRIDTSGNVGIGTATPGTNKVNITSNVATQNNVLTLVQLYAGLNTDLQYYNANNLTSTTIISKRTDGGLWIYQSGADYIAAHTNNTERMRIDSSGNVGIGTTGGTYKLEVQGSVNTYFGQRLYNTNAGSSAVTYLQLGNDTNGATGQLGLNSSANTTNYGGANGLYLSNGLSAPIAFAVGGSERMRIDTAGNLLVGTSTSSARLSVVNVNRAASTFANDVLIQSSAADTSLYYNSTRLSLQNTNATNNTMSHLAFTSSSAFDVAAIWSINTVTTGSSVSGALVFGTTNAATSATERMRIDSSGNVGIGTASADTILQTNTSANRTARFVSTGTYSFVRLEHTGTGACTWDLYTGVGGGSTTFGIANSGGTRLAIDSSGNVGIGTASPTDSASYTGKVLDVAGPGYFRQNGDATKYVSIGTSGGITYLQANGTGNQLAIYTVGSERMRIDSSGNVGIGTASPVGKLSVNLADASGNTAAWDSTYATFGAAGSTAGKAVGIGFNATLNYGEIRSVQPGTAWTDLYIRGSTLNFYYSAAGTSTLGLSLNTSGNLNCLGVYSATVGATNRDVYVDNAGLIGYVSSIRASKTNIAPLSDTNWLLQLQPVTFNYRAKDEDGKYTDTPDGPQQYGLIAEDVEAVAPDLCYYDEVEGQQELRGINYSRLITPLLKLVQDQQATIETLTRRIAALEAKG